jgi:hypothetical protein
MRIKLDKSGVVKIRKLCEDRVNAVKEQCAISAMEYLLNFGYHAVAVSGPGRSPGYSYYYAANWNASVSVIDTSVITPERDPFDEQKGEYVMELTAKQSDLMISVIQQSDIEKSVFVTNSVYYGKWLNDGGSAEFLTYNNDSAPNRFIELCTAHITTSVNGIVQEVIRNVK